MTDIDTARLRALAEKALPDGDDGSYTFDGQHQLRKFQYKVGPETMLALLDELEQARQQIDNQEHNVRTILDDRREVIKAARQAHDVLANSKYRGRDRVARRILRPYIEEPEND